MIGIWCWPSSRATIQVPTFHACSRPLTYHCPRSFVHPGLRDPANLLRSLRFVAHCHSHHCPLVEVACVQNPVEAALAADVSLDRCRWKPTRYFHEANLRCAPRTNTSTEAMTVGPVAAEMNSTVGSVAEDMAPIETKPPRTPERWERAGWGRDIHNHSRIRGDLLKGVPVDDMDVRTILEVGEERQGGKTRRSGDACDSLVLLDTEAVGGLDHRSRGLDRDGRESALDNREVESWGPALDESNPAAGHVPRKWLVVLDGNRSVVHPVAVAPRCFSNADTRYVPAQTLVLEKRLG